MWGGICCLLTLCGGFSVSSRAPFVWLLLLVPLSACERGLRITSPPTTVAPVCDRGPDNDGVAIPSCLLAEGVITPGTYAASQAIVDAARTLRDSLRPLHSDHAMRMSPYLSRSLQSLDEFHARGVLDSVLFDRAIDRVAVTVEFVTGQLRARGSIFKLPSRTPGLIWYEPQGTGGIFFQPASTIFETGMYYGAATLPLDSLVRTAEALWRYATWVDGTGSSAGIRFPVWYYNFHWNGAGVPVAAPWRSGLTQGIALATLAAVFTRTGDPRWRDRASQVARSLTVPWNEGGVLVLDGDGAWWEEYHPVTRIWNGHAFAVLGVGDYLKVVPEDTALARLYPSAVRAARIYAQRYDTGAWLKYSRNEWSVTEAYRTLHVSLARRIAAQTGDASWTEIANRWAGYTRPASEPATELDWVPPDLHAVLKRP